MFVGTPNPITDIVGIATSTIAALTGGIGLIGAAFTLTQNIIDRKEKAILSFDSSLMKFIEIKRTPLKQEDWEKHQVPITSRILSILNYFVLATVASVGGNIFYSFIFTKDLTDFNLQKIVPTDFFLENPIPFILFIALFICSYVFLYFSAISIKSKQGNTPEEARFSLFENASIIVEAEHQYLFDRCLEVLKVLQADAIEFNATQSLLEASLRRQLNRVPGRLTIEIQPFQVNTGKKTIWFKSSPKSNQYLIQANFYPFASQTTINKSKVVNLFIKQFMGKIEQVYPHEIKK